MTDSQTATKTARNSLSIVVFKPIYRVGRKGVDKRVYHQKSRVWHAQTKATGKMRNKDAE